MRRISRTFGVIGAVFSLAGCFHHDPSLDQPKPQLSAAPQTAKMRFQNFDRSYVLYVPRNLPARAPLLFVLHDAAQNGADIEHTTGFAFDRLADRYGFAVVYPNGYDREWNDCRKDVSSKAHRLHVDDKDFIRTLIARMAQDHGIDPRKVFAVGHADGGEMVYRLALEQPRDFAGLAVISAGVPSADDMACAAVREPIPMMIINGTHDPLSPYDGGDDTGFLGLGSRGQILSTAASAATFTALNGDAGAPQTTRLPHQDSADPTWVEESQWAGATPVIVYTIHGGGHVVPQPYNRYPPFLGRQTKDLDAPAAIWDFFSGIAAKQP